MRGQHITYAFFVVGALLALGYFLYPTAAAEPYTEAATIVENVAHFKDLSDRFQRLAEEKGALYAYEILRRADLPPNTDVHLLGHTVGDVLYEQKGMDGIRDCTQDFRNACSHTIVIGALNEFGEEALEMIRDACKQAPGGSGAYTMCFHGLGHGVFAYYAYDIPQTVAFCAKTGTDERRNREYIECVGGMVMELMGGGGHDRDAWLHAREKYLATPLGPCMESLIPEETKPICLIYLTPHIWQSAGIDMGRPDPDLFPKAFAACDGIADTTLRDACYDGFGKEFPTLAAERDVRNLAGLPDASIAKIGEWCMKAPERGRVPCMLSGLHSLFWGGENDPKLSFRYCAVLPAAYTDACHRELAQELRRYLPAADRAPWCAKLPEGARAACGT